MHSMKAGFRTVSLSIRVLLAVGCLATAGCSKDKKDDGDAAADAASDAAADATIADAAADAADAADAATAPLTVAPVRPKATPPPPAPDPPICVNARVARARNSPAAAGLEAQCRAAGGKP